MRIRPPKNSGWLIQLSIGLLLVPALTRGQSADRIGKLFEKMSWRGIGPAVMGGRTVDIEAAEKKPWTIYAAVGPSGVWKSDNAGVTWSPVFFKEATVSVGDVTIAPSHPDTVWAGTGEATCRNSVTIGDGVYKSTDGGKTWKNMGLKETRHVSRIVVNPGDPNIVFVAAMGHLWGPNTDRGVFKTTDGGRTWKKVLYVDENTGCADLAMDPADSLTLYAAAYEHRRAPHYFSSGGPGSGLYKTADGGETWTRLAKGLPEGILGRIGVAVAPSAPGVVYALIEHKEGGIWRSEDRGESWSRTADIDTARRVATRPFYYSHIRVDPTNDKVVYVQSTGFFVSMDGGRKFRAIGAGIHSDHHALWIDPSNPLHLIAGNDGGIDISYDGGKTWLPVQSMDLAEVYQVGTDMRRPYYVYCGLQDNGSWGGPSATFDAAGIANDDWVAIGGGDGFFTQPDPADPNTVYGNSQMNGLSRYDWRIFKNKAIRPMAGFTDPPFRFNWNSPIHISPHDSHTVYTGGHVLIKSTDRGISWEIISPDLTTNDPEKQKDSGGPITPDNSGAESHCTITTIAESPLERGLIWCGTDDGNLQLTRDGGKTWTNVGGNFKGLPRHTWCSRVEASHFDSGTAYAAFDGHRTDDYATYLYQTADFGKTWTSIKGNLPFGWVHVVREDPKNRNLLYVGTDFAIFASLDSGLSWFSLKNNLPTVAVHDITVHPRENDLIIGTHGRGVFILDNISYLQEMTPEVLGSPVHLFTARPATAFYQSARRESFTKPPFAARNPMYGLAITAYFQAKPKEKPRVSILNGRGEPVFEFDFSAKEGLQRDYWSLQTVPRTKEGRRIVPSAVAAATLPLVAPGEFTIELAVDGQKFQTPGVVLADPRIPMTAADLSAQHDALAEILALSKKMGLAITAASSIRSQLDPLLEILKKEGRTEPSPDGLIRAFSDRFRSIEEKVVPRDLAMTSMSREQALRGGPLNLQIISLGVSISGFPAAPTKTELFQLAQIKQRVDSPVEELNRIIGEDIPALNKVLEQNGQKPLRAPDEVKL
ncbi:MAG: hypothetical protein H6P98_363 [Candidatus Aminicenantes bacterium]|nr:hypothetical protein [Candidatus Aminicenantes bacterium]